MWSLKSLSNTSSPVDGSIVVSGDPSVLNGVNSISLILLVSSPPLTLKKALIDEDDLTLAATLISKAVDGFSKFTILVTYTPSEYPPSIAVSS